MFKNLSSPELKAQLMFVIHLFSVCINYSFISMSTKQIVIELATMHPRVNMVKEIQDCWNERPSPLPWGDK